ncbi:MAG: helix-turn-helix transcriptional regulator [Oscillospiraceae bacterium]
MNQRFKKIRLTLNLSQEEFGNKIGIKSRSHISSLESGARNITDRIINDLFKEFNVNEEWLRTGVGEMFIESDESIINEFVSEYKLSPFEKMMLESYLKLTDEQRHVVTAYIKNLFDANMSSKNTSSLDLSKKEDTPVHSFSSSSNEMAAAEAPNINGITLNDFDEKAQLEALRFVMEQEAENKGKTYLDSKKHLIG